MLVTGAALPFSGSGTTADEGIIHTGVGSEDEARALPCPPGSSGPVVCVPDRGTSWRLTSDASGECSEGPVGWQGDCVRAFDAGDHLRVWGTRGLPPRTFRITWASSDPDGGGSAAPGAEGGTSGDRTTARQDSAPPPPRVAAPRTSAVGPAPPGPVDPEPARGAPAAQARAREVPDGVFWDPPASDVPGYSDLLAAPGPTYPHVPLTRRGRGDAGAPAAAGLVALVAAGWVLREHRKAGRTDAVG